MKTGDIQAQIESELAGREPEVDVVLAEVVGGSSGGTLRLLIDTPGGVNHELCARVTDHLRGWLDRYSLEVSSPGIERPLTKPEHFRRFVGHRARIRVGEPQDGRRRFTGDLLSTNRDGIAIKTESGETLKLSFDVIVKANLADDLSRRD